MILSHRGGIGKREIEIKKRKKLRDVIKEKERYKKRVIIICVRRKCEKRRDDKSIVGIGC